MKPQKIAYATDDPAVLDAYRAARAARHEFSRRLLADAAALGHNRGPRSRKGPHGGEEIVGLEPDGSGIAPPGWHLVEQGRRLAPRIGYLGNKARAWLVQHQLPDGADALQVLLEHGLVAQSRVEYGGKFTVYRPALFEWDGRLWACYLGRPEADDGGEPAGLTWPQVPLDDCLAALARAEAATTAHAN